MQQREPFDVATGKRRYRNMLISGLTCQTDEKTEDISLISVRLREVNIVSTQTTSAPKSAQANPAKTGSTADAGTQQLKTGPGGRVVGGV